MLNYEMLAPLATVYIWCECTVDAFIYLFIYSIFTVITKKDTHNMIRIKIKIIIIIIIFTLITIEVHNKAVGKSRRELTNHACSNLRKVLCAQQSVRL